MDRKKGSPKHIVLTSHPATGARKPLPIHWGAPTAKERGPVIGTVTHPGHRNVIGTHSGSYSVYRALAVAAGQLDPDHVPDLTNTSPADHIGPLQAVGGSGEDRLHRSAMAIWSARRSPIC